jgi:hypothetical protein
MWAITVILRGVTVGQCRAFYKRYPCGKPACYCAQCCVVLQWSRLNCCPGYGLSRIMGNEARCEILTQGAVYFLYSPAFSPPSFAPTLKSFCSWRSFAVSSFPLANHAGTIGECPFCEQRVFPEYNPARAPQSGHCKTMRLFWDFTIIISSRIGLMRIIITRESSIYSGSIHAMCVSRYIETQAKQNLRG